MLEIRNVHKTFNLGTINEKHALNGVDLKLDEGDFVTVIITPQLCSRTNCPSSFSRCARCFLRAAAGIRFFLRNFILSPGYPHSVRILL